MVFIHPLIQAVAVLLGLYTAYLGWERFTGKTFRWNRHVRLGLIFVVMITLGSLVGTVVTYKLEGGILLTGVHALLPFIIIPLLLIGGSLGLVMARGKKVKFMPVLHMVINYLAMLLILLQSILGVFLISEFLNK